MRKSLLVSVLSLSIFLSQSARADDPVIPCNLDAYTTRIGEVKKFSRKEQSAVYTPAAIGGTLIYLAGKHGVGSAPVVIAGAGALAVAGVDYVVIKGKKKFQARHYQEVSDNIAEAMDLKDGEFHVTHTRHLMELADHKKYTQDEVINAITDLNASGAFCVDSKLVVTKKFRQLLSKKIAENKIAAAEVSSPSVATAQDGAVPVAEVALAAAAVSAASAR